MFGSSARSVLDDSGLRNRSEGDRESFQDAHGRLAELPVRLLVDETDRGKALDDGLEDHLRFEARQGRPDAEVDALPEGQMAAARPLDVERLESFLKLDDEIEELVRRAKKRQMTTERRAKRNTRIKARNLNDRIEWEREQRGEWRE